jgi:hypothetical protein
MGNGKGIVVTAYGHDRNIDKIAVSLFDCPNDTNKSNADTYCETINHLELKGNAWVYARRISENVQYEVSSFLPCYFSNIIPSLDGAAIIKILLEIDAQSLAKALKGESEMVKEAIFKHMSEKAVQMLKEDMEYMGPVRIIDVKGAREKISTVIWNLVESGEIVINSKSDRMVE